MVSFTYERGDRRLVMHLGWLDYDEDDHMHHFVNRDFVSVGGGTMDIYNRNRNVGFGITLTPAIYTQYSEDGIWKSSARASVSRSGTT